MKTAMKNTLALLFIGTASAGGAQESGAPYIIEENGRSFSNLQEAVHSIGSGTGTILIQPGVYRDCAVQEGGNVTFRATIPGQVIFDTKICEEKGVLVLRGRNSVVDGIIFQNLKNHSRDGAGIRFETGNLKVTRSLFRNSYQGILTAHDPKATMIVEQSTFTGLGRCDPDHNCAHSIYGGHIYSIEVRNCRFERGTSGHYVKFRGKVATITSNAFDDSNGSRTNYMIDLPNGAIGEISNNIFVQGPNKENPSALITVTAEEKKNSSTGLTIVNNEASLAPGAPQNPAFVADWSGEQLNIGANRLGRGITPFVRR